ncbi:MAG: hypothetical protein KJP02_03000 [Octadecabacter sp.]|nr:hypothetical protein [Octadecabacter sp.]
MGAYFSDKWEALTGLPAAIAAAPLFFAIVFAIGLPLIWWKWKVMGDGMQKAVADLSYGLRTDADRKQVRHETGIGTREILVMRPPKLSKMIYFALFFFGGGAVFYFILYLPSDLAEPDDWWTFAGAAGFTIAVMIIIEANQTRIYVDDHSLQRRRVLHRRQTIAFKDIASIEPLAKAFMGGMVLRTRDGQRLRVRAQFSGYRELIARLAPYDRNMALLAKMPKPKAR